MVKPGGKNHCHSRSICSAPGPYYDYQLSKVQQNFSDKCFGTKITMSPWETFLISSGNNDIKGRQVAIGKCASCL